MEATQFHIIADELLQSLLDRIEAVSRFDGDYLHGTLELKCTDGKIYVINKHEPTRQIWLSSPFSGASKFSYDEAQKKWIDRDKKIFPAIVETELSKNYNINI